MSQTRFDAGNPRELTFRLGYNLPRRPDLYTLALLNCKGSDIRVEGEATFTGADGEKLSIPQAMRRPWQRGGSGNAAVVATRR